MPGSEGFHVPKSQSRDLSGPREAVRLGHELVMLLSSWIPGALGLWLRSCIYPLLLGRVGRGVIFGTNVVLRHPHKIYLGTNDVIDDNCVLDPKGTDNKGVFIDFWRDLMSGTGSRLSTWSATGSRFLRPRQR